MLYNIANLRDLAIQATEGEIGSVDDVYFDDEAWTVRYLVVDTGSWLPGRRVLISPISVKAIDWNRRKLALDLTREQIKSAPDVDTEKPVSRQYEARYFRYYDYPYYWTGPYLWGVSPYPTTAPQREYELARNRQQAQAARQAEESHSHLRSAREVAGYHIVAPDGSIGHVETLLVDPASWNIRAIAVDTRNWLPGKHVLMPTEWVERVTWSERSVHVNVSRETIRSNPEYDSAAPMEERTVECLLQLRRFGSRQAGSRAARRTQRSSRVTVGSRSRNPKI